MSGANDNIIWLDGYDTSKAVKFYLPGGSEKTQYLSTADSFNASNPANATQVTLNGTVGDYGRQSSIKPSEGNKADEGYKNGGQEYYLSLYTVQASQANSQLIANHKVNYIYAIGGTKNILTGGIAADRFNFTTSGGVVTDFGVGATNSSKKATATTSSLYDRNDPRTYAEGIDILQVNGIVKEVAFDGYKKGSATAGEETFTAYVTYENSDGDDYTVALTNICKKATKTGYQTDDVAAKTLKVWDTSTSTDGATLKVISATNLAKLFTTVDESAYADNISELSELVTELKGNNGIFHAKDDKQTTSYLIEQLEVTASNGDDDNPKG